MLDLSHVDCSSSERQIPVQHWGIWSFLCAPQSLQCANFLVHHQNTWCSGTEPAKIVSANIAPSQSHTKVNMRKSSGPTTFSTLLAPVCDGGNTGLSWIVNPTDCMAMPRKTRGDTWGQHSTLRKIEKNEKSRTTSASSPLLMKAVTVICRDLSTP